MACVAVVNICVVYYSVLAKVCHHVTASNPASCVYVVTATAKQWVYVNF